ncbi:amino acid/polyamine/organocation transporter (APC superfamily) [Streptomyces sp. SLBN-118]|uniref:amino acid permease n=1 Tax=Streptomyces sp. SLBN-118 TaxID=2768454 RepID=UPI00114F6B31|nr:amino acid permease [Streptomyces sp. SLBN-118]TQK42969.1 amino acid/polyamine/organocation transporter (APC superfamily) [Streptomyces sp. SLBN-118]
MSERTSVLRSKNRHDAESVALDDDATLHAMGYPRKLTRRFRAFDNFAISFTIINILSGIFSAFGFGMGAGGPRILVFGWIGVSVMVLFVGAAMGEIASAYPTSGALYFSAGKLAKRHRGAWSWYTGWLNFVGQVGGTAATGYAAATFVQAFIVMQWPGYEVTSQRTVLFTAVILVLQALANTYTVQLVAALNRISVWWLLIGMVVIVVALTVKPSHHQSASFVTHFANNTGFTNGIYAAMLGLLVTSWTFTGFDGSFHMSEETVRATVNTPKGIMRAISYSAGAGLILMLALVYAIHDYAAEASAAAPPVQILVDALGMGTAKLLLLIVIGAMLFCGLANMTSNTRQIFAFSRDGAMPGSRWWHSVSLRTRTPVNAVWLAAACSMALIIPAWWSHTAFTAIVSVNVVGLYLAYGVPIFLRLRLDDFEPGPWNLGRWGKPVGVIAVTWIVFSSALFMLPQVSPITGTTFNYAPIALGVVLLIATVWWFATARRRFHGPVSYGSPDEVAAMDLI